MDAGLILVDVVVVLTALSALGFLGNVWAFRHHPVKACPVSLPGVSVLVPARNEQDGIAALIASVLAAAEHAGAGQTATGSPVAAATAAEPAGRPPLQFELVILDDDSDDFTAAIVTDAAGRDERVRLVRGARLPSGWCGKQYACAQLAAHARFDHWIFLDADVRLAAGSLQRLLVYFVQRQADLLSGFPRQVVATLGEALLVPLIHVILLCYLPFFFMRHTSWPAFAAGCGQLFITTRAAYAASGGHGSIRGSLHDGLMLPRAYRRAGRTTDLFDAAGLAQCRMYRGARTSMEGVVKNAHEGFARWPAIFLITALMLATFVAPPLLFLAAVAGGAEPACIAAAGASVAFCYLPRLICARLYDRHWLSAVMFPVSVLLFLTLQWFAWVRHLRGIPSAWRGRSYAATA